MKVLIVLSILLFPLVILVLQTSATSFTPNTFFVYNQTVKMVLPNGTIATINEVILQRITEVFPNGSIIINETIYDVNQHYYIPPVIVIDNSTFPQHLYYIPPSLLGKNVTRGRGELYFINYSNGLYEYESKTSIQGVFIEFIMWVNSSGVAVKVQTLQIGASLQLVSNATAILWKTNYFNPSVPLPIFSGYTKANVVTAHLNGGYYYYFPEKMFKYILIIGILAIILILLFRKR